VTFGDRHSDLIRTLQPLAMKKLRVLPRDAFTI
jgi:hypothetical protein